MRLVDLSHKIIPGGEKYRVRVDQYSVDEYLPEYTVDEGQWYVMQDVLICTHAGTHVEAPYHAIKGGITAGELDASRLVGMASIVDFTDKKYQSPILLDEMKERGAHIQTGDIVIIKTGLSKYYGTSQYKRPYIEKDTVDWLVDTMKISALGVDCSGIENRSKGNSSVLHIKLFSNNIPIIEDLNNVDKLSANRVFFFALTMKLKGIDASWIRPVAIDDSECSTKILDLVRCAEWVGFDINER